METAPSPPSRGQLRLIADSEQASPQERIGAANSLLQLYGASDRNLRLARRVSKRFGKFVGDTETGQRRVRWAAEQLAGRIERIVEGNPQPADENDRIDSVQAEPSTPTCKAVIIGKIDLLPVDGDDEFWDELLGAHSRRDLFLLSWLLDPSLSQREIIAAISDPARTKAHTLELKLWARTREQLDDKFKSDNALITAALAERRLEDSDAGRDELIRQVRASGKPLVKFHQPTDPDEVALPVLVRTETGLLLDAIDFTKSWPLTRAKHQPL